MCLKRIFAFVSFFVLLVQTNWAAPQPKASSPKALIKAEVLPQRWVSVDSPRGVGYVPAQHLLTHDLLHHFEVLETKRVALDNWGRAFVKHTTALRQSPKGKSQVIKNLIFGQFIDVLGFHGDWVKVSHQQKVGYVLLSQLITRLEYASQVRLKGEWVKVDWNIGSWLKLANDAYVSSEEISQIRTVGTIGFALQNQVKVFKTTNLKSAVLHQFEYLDAIKIMNPSPVVYAPDIAPLEMASHQQGLKTEEVFKRRIYDLASSPRDPNFMLASAQGIFHSSDGQSWSRLTFFGDKNYPIAITSEGTIFVGPYKSDDNGKTFVSYIKWENMIPLVVKKIQKAPTQLQITKIDLQDPVGDVMEILVHVGETQPIRLKSVNRGFNWSLEN